MRTPALVDGFAQAFARFETDRGTGSDGQRFAGLGVFAGAGVAVAAFERAETDQTDIVAAAEGISDFIEDGGQCLLGLVGGNIDAVGNVGGQVRFAHDWSLVMSGFAMGGWKRQIGMMAGRAPRHLTAAGPSE